MEKSIINCHTHAFNFQCVPDSFLTNYASRFIAPIAARLLRTRFLSAPTLFLLNKLSKGNFKKTVDFLMIGNKKTVNEVFDELKSNYQATYPDAKFVILTMNFDHMDNTGYRGLFNTQLEMVKKLKRQNPDSVLPFLGIDPRMELHGRDINSFLMEYFNPDAYSGFVGLKIYPSLGFYPFHPRMQPVYEFAIENELPIMTHCTPDGAFWADKKLPVHLQFPLSFNPVDQNSNLDINIKNQAIALKEKIVTQYHLKPDTFCDYFLHPLNYWDVLLKYPDLKICLAHTGGEETITGKETRETAKEWYQDIKNLLNIGKFPNLYVDLSFVLNSKDAVEALKRDLENGSLPIEKMLFGTDFFMTARIRKERNLVEIFKQQIGENIWEQIAIINPRKYLSSKLYLA